MTDIRVVLADDHSIVRRGVRRVLEKSPEIQIVGEAENGNEALQLTEALLPDVLLLDVEMPGLKGYEVARKLSASKSPVRILALSSYTERSYILGMFTSGAAGYVTKDEIGTELNKAVQLIAEGIRGWISPRAAEKLSFTAYTGDKIPSHPLDGMEKSVLKQIVDGKTDLEIGENLNLETPLVREIVNAVIKKMRAKSRWEAALRALQKGLA